MGLGFLAINTVLALVPFAGLAWLYQFRLFDIPVVWWSWVLLLFAEDFCYYWFHRLHHEVRTLWAAHVNHHSSTRYNFSTALRQSWTTPFTGFSGSCGRTPPTHFQTIHLVANQSFGPLGNQGWMP
jgi:sterol desaturase/sphingolipid hydroxylase (fatty acid hydroxylase superfamily)